MIILGVHGGVTLNQHEASAALSIDGKIVALCEEERYLRIKSCYGLLPVAAIRACLRHAGIEFGDVDLVVATGITYADHAQRWGDYLQHNFGHRPKIELVHHQQAHLAAAFYASGYEESLCVSIDASGDGDCCHVAYASRTGGIKLLETVPSANSLGYFFTLMTHYVGFTDGDEYKVMGLAPYGEDNVDLSKIIAPSPAGWVFNRNFVRSAPPLHSPFEPMYSAALTGLLGPARVPDTEYGTFYRNVARSTQAMFERCLISKLRYATSLCPGLKSLCYAGGAALNCSANGMLRKSGLFDNIFVPPVASDRGLSLGCAYLGAASAGDTLMPLENAYLGTTYTDEQIRTELVANSSRHVHVDDPAAAAAVLLAQGSIIGWHQGRSEAGARALGNRSILASCSEADMKNKVNARIKYREEFRPFAPVALAEHAMNFFLTSGKDSPYMCFTVEAHPENSERIPAVVHVDGTARLQTVRPSENELLATLLERYADLTGVPVLMNTSFNLKNQPIVETPRDALMTFHGCGLDAMIIGNYVVSK